MSISEIDKLLLQFEIKFPQKSRSRIIEEQKYQQIYAVRDGYIYDSIHHANNN